MFCLSPLFSSPPFSKNSPTVMAAQGVRECRVSVASLLPRTEQRGRKSRGLVAFHLWCSWLMMNKFGLRKEHTSHDIASSICGERCVSTRLMKGYVDTLPPHRNVDGPQFKATALESRRMGTPPCCCSLLSPPHPRMIPFACPHARY